MELSPEEEKLFSACQIGNLGRIQELITTGVNVNVVNKFGFTPLYYGCESGKINVVKFLIEAGADIRIVGLYGITPLHTVCKFGCAEIALTLIEKGADINIFDKNKNTPLHIASKLNNFEIISALIKNGANVNLINKEKDTPLHIIEDAESGIALIEAGANIDSVGNNNMTPLHHACKINNLKLVYTLIEKGADINNDSYEKRFRYEALAIPKVIELREAKRGTKFSSVELIEQNKELLYGKVRLLNAVYILKREKELSSDDQKMLKEVIKEALISHIDILERNKEIENFCNEVKEGWLVIDATNSFTSLFDIFEKTKNNQFLKFFIEIIAKEISNNAAKSVIWGVKQISNVVELINKYMSEEIIAQLLAKSKIFSEDTIFLQNVFASYTENRIKE